MNFEFKSTFKNMSFTRSCIRLSKLIRSIDHSFWITCINVLALVVTGSLYLQNYLIPGTYGSGPNGDLWVDALLMLAHIWTITTSYSLLRLLYICNLSEVHQILSVLTLRIRRIMADVQDLIPVVALQTIMLANLILNEPRRSGRYRHTSSLNPLTHINVTLTV